MGWMPDFPHIVHLQLFYEVSAGALIYLYVRSCTEKNFEMKPVLWLHFLPVLIYLFYSIPYLLQSGEEKFAFYHEYVMEFKNQGPLWLSVLKCSLASVYLVLSFRLIQQYKRHLTNEASYIDATYHQWLLLFSSSVLLPIVGIMAWAFLGASETTKTVTLAFIFLFIFSIYLVSLFKPEIFHTFPNQIIVKEEEEVKKQKYESSSLKEAKKEQFIEKLVKHMEVEKPYRESDLVLSALAEQVDIPAHYLSQVINEKMNCSFLDFVNGYRVEEAKQMLHSVDYENYTIIAVAYEAGFNSKTAFYSAFKKHAGETPSAFRKSVQNASNV
jgi:AraC-like DNA-binding protein